MIFKLALLKPHILSFLIGMYMLLCFLAKYTGSAIFSYMGYTVVIVAAFIALTRNKRLTYETSYFSLLILITLFFLVAQLVHFRNPAFVLLIPINGLLIYVIGREKLHSFYFYITLLLIALFCIRGMVQGVNPNTFLSYSSRNVVSVLLFFNVALLHFVEYKNGKSLSILPCLLFVTISVWCIGRAGIVSSVLYLLLVIYCRAVELPLKKRAAFLLVVVLVSGALLYRFKDEIALVTSTYLERVVNRGISYEEDPRNELLGRYFRHLNPLTFLLGYDYTKDVFFSYFNYNPHNSFIRLHYYIGVFSSVFIWFLVVKTAKLFRNDKFIFFTIVLICFRGWIDTILFVGEYDFILGIFLLFKTTEYSCYEPQRTLIYR